jgi:hypothetical protein
MILNFSEEENLNKPILIDPSYTFADDPYYYRDNISTIQSDYIRDWLILMRGIIFISFIVIVVFFILLIFYGSRSIILV